MRKLPPAALLALALATPFAHAETQQARPDPAIESPMYAKVPAHPPAATVAFVKDRRHCAVLLDLNGEHGPAGDPTFMADYRRALDALNMKFMASVQVVEQMCESKYSKPGKAS
jgi:hypothetical protein